MPTADWVAGCRAGLEHRWHYPEQTRRILVRLEPLSADRSDDGTPPGSSDEYRAGWRRGLLGWPGSTL